MAYCEECGAKLDDDANFCAKCGHAVKPSDTVQRLAGAVQDIVRDIDAPAAAGETVLSSWQGGVAAPVSPETVVAGAQVIAAAAAKQGEPHQLSVHSSSQNRGEAAPSVKKSPIPKILGTVGVVVIIALIALYVVPLFIWHPVDPHEHEALTSDTAQSASSGATASASSTATTSSVKTESGATSTSTTTESSSNEQTKTNFSTTDKPTLKEFDWLTGDAAKGNVPADARRITDLGSVTGGWKGYIFGSGMEWLMNADIEVAQEGPTVTIDWYYVRIGSTGESKEDGSSNSNFTGTWSGNSLDATGSGRITLAAFWEKDGYQYATGSFIWPSGESCNVALVRP